MGRRHQDLWDYLHVFWLLLIPGCSAGEFKRLSGLIVYYVSGLSLKGQKFHLIGYHIAHLKCCFQLNHFFCQSIARRSFLMQDLTWMMDLYNSDDITDSFEMLAGDHILNITMFILWRLVT